ncbi:MAG: aldo/keto reductase [Oceanipulchritudo sp.]
MTDPKRMESGGSDGLSEMPLGLGCWALGGRGWGGQAEKEAFAVMEAALECGVCHFDTARAYGNSEKVVGRFIEKRREAVFLASKVLPGEAPAAIRCGLELSLRNLRTDYIDLYYLHWPVEGLDIRPQVEVLEQKRAAGLIGSIGVSNYSVGQLRQAREAGTIDFLQVGYHLFWRVIEKEILPCCMEEGIPVIAYSSLGQGLLTGKFGPVPGFAKGDHRPGSVLHFREDIWPAVHAATDEVKRLAKEAGRPPSHLALQWAARRTGIRGVLAGARNRRQMMENAAAFGETLPEEVFLEMDRISNRLTPRLPEAENVFGKAFPKA